MNTKKKLGHNNALDVVNYILKRGKELGKKFTPMQMIKLVYLAHSWFMATYSKDKNSLIPLINERVEAWHYGPVIPIVYHAVKQFRSSPIRGPILGGDAEGGNLSKNERAAIDVVIEVYGDKSGAELSALTHREGTPWQKTYQGTLYVEIQAKDIFHYYKSILDK